MNKNNREKEKRIEEKKGSWREVFYIKLLLQKERKMPEKCFILNCFLLGGPSGKLLFMELSTNSEYISKT